MALNINGTTGISGVDGSVSAPAVTGTDSNTGITFPSADTIKFSTGGVERMSITNSGVSGITAGITMADQWRVSSSFTLGGSVATINSNWERNDTTGYAKIGTGMSQTSGVFTFPETGIYRIDFVCGMASTSALRYVGHRIQTTTNNSSYAHHSDVLNNCGLTNSFGAYITTSSSVILDVTDTSQCKVRFAGVSITSSVTSVLGDNGRNTTFATFTRLGDT